MIKYIISFLFCLSFAYAEEYSKTYTACMDKAGGVTSPMVQCTYAENAAWDKQLNSAYQDTMKSLSPFKKKKLLEAQRLWVQFRDSSCALYTDPDGGTIELIQYADCLLSMTKTRTIELRSLKNDL